VAIRFKQHPLLIRKLGHRENQNRPVPLPEAISGMQLDAEMKEAAN
jgi:hypothetical protein